MKNFSLAILFLFSLSGIAQTTGITRYNATTVYSQEFRKMVSTSDGGYLAVSNSGLHGRICKLSAGYIPLWSFDIDSMPIFDAVETNDGNYVFMGNNYYSAYASGSVFILKLSTTGTVVFQKMYYDPTFVTTLTSSGINKAAGSDQGFVFFGGNCMAMHYMVKCDVNGNVQWQNAYLGFNGNGYFASVLTESSGYVIAGATYFSSIESAYILKLDANGNPLNARIMQGPSSIELKYSSLVKLNNGDYFIWTKSGDVPGAQNYTVSSSFSSVTCNRITGVSPLEFTAVSATGNASDNLLLNFIGYNNFYGGGLEVSPTGTIAWQKYSSSASNLFNIIGSLPLHNGTNIMNGNINNQQAAIGVVDDNGNGFCSSQNTTLLATQNYSVTVTTPTITTYAITIGSATVNFPITTITYAFQNLCGSLTGIPVLAANENEINVFPNPTNNVLSIDTKNEMIKTISIFDMQGRMVLSVEHIDDTNYSVELSTLEKGMYLVKVATENGSFTQKIIHE